MTMSGDPHEKIRRVLESSNQFRQGYGIISSSYGSQSTNFPGPGTATPVTKPPFGLVTNLYDGDRDMRRDDHELIGSLTSHKFRLKPCPPVGVKKTMAVNIFRAVGFRLGIVEHDNFERYIRLRQETVTGKTALLGGIDQIKTVTDRLGGCFKKFADPLRSSKRAAIRIGDNRRRL
jgi:hypothetical protein